MGCVFLHIYHLCISTQQFYLNVCGDVCVCRLCKGEMNSSQTIRACVCVRVCTRKGVLGLCHELLPLPLFFCLSLS